MRKNTIVHIAAAALAALVCTSASASNWHFAWVGNKETRFYFDAESVERSKDTITVWIKSVQVSQPENDGSWAMAMRWRFNCSKRTIQSLAYSMYDKDGKFIRSGSGPTTEEAAIPDSTGEGMLKLACKPNFPNDKSGKDYFKLEDNDVFRATRDYAEMINSQKDPAPK